jgi:uncharacterized coiled-coil protein SlyX
MESEADPERFISLEVKMAYLEKTMHDLNEVVVAQARHIDDLIRRLGQLEKHVRADSEGREFAHEKPPHY